ncbi:AAA family ATPase [Thalassotalea sp. PS06]|uniref:AAA family ATPase n=1 Tax=Thalassotalea sp. PS06 TaxID=2594005 RepID=UPI0011629A13|nr:SMC family ATPase [Thalassotalea sp. PS06]QDP01633.1 SMC family ATPase [Thalassotalea sp. PS06]
MKFLTLSVQAFGPFADKQVIDFQKLGDAPLFLIDGPTGAGKSSILHAICFALYGETTDEARKDFAVRSDNANDDILTQVELTFTIRDKRYRITRTPTQLRPAKRGDGFTEEKASAHFCQFLDDGTEVTLVAKKKKDADDMIREIIGLTVDQFRQVMVLPQGKFRELLLAKSDARQSILSTLFQTQIYQKIEQILKDKAALIKGDYEQLQEMINQALQEAEVQEISQLKSREEQQIQKLAELTASKQQLETQRQQAIVAYQEGKKLAEDFSEHTRLQHSQAEHLQRQQEMALQANKLQLSEQAARIEPGFKVLQAQQADIKQLQTQITETEQLEAQTVENLQRSEQQLQAAQQQHQQRQPLLDQQQKLVIFQETLAGFDVIKQECQQKSAAEQSARQNIEQAKAKIEEYSGRVKKGEALIQSLQLNVDKMPAAIEHQAMLEQQITASRQLQQLIDKQQSLNQEFGQRQTLVKQSQVLLETENKTLMTIEFQWHSSQAAILAAQLNPGDACPVCGSKEHPAPARLDAASGSQVVNKSMIDEQRARRDEKQQGLQNAQVDLAKIEQELNVCQAQQQQLIDSQKQTQGNGILPLEELEQTLAQHRQIINGLKQDQQQLIKAGEKLRAMQTELQRLMANLQELEQALPALAADSATAAMKLADAEKGLPEQYRDKSILDKAVNDNQQSLAKLDSQLAEAQQNFQKVSQDLSAIGSKKTTQLQHAEQMQQKLQQLETQWQEQLTASHFDDQNAFLAACIDEFSLRRLQQDVSEYQQRAKTLADNLSLLAERLKEKSAPDLSALQANLDNTDHQYQIHEKEVNQASIAVANSTNILKRIAEYQSRQEQHREDYEVIGTLANAASGKGKVRVSLERFVLADILDNVLSIASQRLHIMSKGQYRLVRQAEAQQKRNVTAGLDLAVDDAHTGKVRPVATLSGGESFMASLALALALSEVVQQRSGGIELDTLFIDEGFGSLDHESLQLAINTLIDLQSTGRTIGVISHVNELKEQMAQRIDVRNDGGGSKISLSNM